MNARRRLGLVAGILGFAVAGSQAATMHLVPVNASGTNVIAGNQITLTGTPQRVYLELQVAGWAPARVKTVQGTLDCAGLSSGTSGTLTPALRTCVANADCTPAIPTGYGPGAICATNGGGQPGKCQAGVNQGLQCFSNGDCPASVCIAACENAFINTADPRYIFPPPAGVIAASSTQSCNTSLGATLISGAPVTDPGTARYAGTLVLDVPSGAVGTFTLQLNPDEAGTFLGDEFEVNVPLTILPHATIVVKCTVNGNCNDNNACTTDTCNTGNGLCVNQPNFNTGTLCCNPANGNTVPLTDNNECTSDLCNALTGGVSHPNLPNGAACGNPGNTQCDRPDSCNGAGVCTPQFEVAGTACGSPTNTECNLADTCNGTGTCLTNLAPANANCGSQTSGPCDAADKCNGLGVCLTNTVANNTPCDDALFCQDNTVCLSGVCQGGVAHLCDDLLTCTADTCNETLNQCEFTQLAGTCKIDDGGGFVCYLEGVLNPTSTCEACVTASSNSDWTVLADGTECNDGNACTGTGRIGIGVDECTAGVCAGVLDPQCNDQCEFAVPAIVGANFSNNSSAGVDDGEASCQVDSNADVWFEYVADCDGTLFLSTTGSVLLPDNDTVLNVFSACPLDGGTELACDDDSGVGLQSALILPTVQSTTYFIRVAGFGGNKGAVRLNVQPIGDCLIDDVCYFDGEVNPANGCQACIPELSTTQWSNLFEGTACGNNVDTECSSPDACDGAGFCEPNHKVDGTLCSDEVPAIQCTQNFCQSGLCTHPPEPVGLPCGDPTDTPCDNPDTCDGGGNCNPRFEDDGFQCGDQTKTNCNAPDTCNGTGTCLANIRADGTICDDKDICTKQDHCTAGVCGGVNRSDAPTVVGFGGLAIKVTPLPANSTAPVALRLTSPTWPCVDKYITAAGSLGAVPVFQTPAVWGTVTVAHPDIVPSSTYVVVAECGSLTSNPGQGITGVWGDMDLNGIVNFSDVFLLVAVFKGQVPNIPAIYDITPCEPNNLVNFSDISLVVRAFQSAPYPCAIPCP